MFTVLMLVYLLIFCEMLKFYSGLSALFASVVTFVSGVTFTLAQTDLNKIGSGATDTANSLVGVVGSLLPILIPLLVVGFAISLVMGVFRR